MALTYQQKCNIRLGRGVDDAVTLVEKIGEGIRQVCADILRGTTTISDTLIAPSGCTQASLNIIAERGIRGQMYEHMAAAITSDAAFETNGVSVSDVQIQNAIKRQIGYFAKWVGSAL